MPKEIELKGSRRPSKAQVLSSALSHIKSSTEDVDIIWGENTIEFKYMFGKWCGFGWIGKVGGQDLAVELNQQAGR